MARPIPDINLRDISKQEDIKPRESRSYFDLTLDRITNNRSSRNLVFGTLSGWVAGVSVIRVGKVAAFGLGGGVILLHFASELGYINVNWDRVREAAGQSQAWVDRVMQFVKKNSCFSVGFVGGFFFGIAST
ncbi:FUN14 domain-containing protein 1-like [Ostrinia furnacalis]|uniref:FUN14 domain-containing protein 1-like n=1 Tax=Ostrinia furnacalis TaxID=93504 RepID=UPI00103D9C0A|nr:FUN14 domain-containing protein 1-like [Ostrinia furnacalis]